MTIKLILLVFLYIVPVAFCLGYATLKYKLKESLFKSSQEGLGRYFTKKSFEVNEFLGNVFVTFCPILNIIMCLILIFEGKRETILKDLNLEDK